MHKMYVGCYNFMFEGAVKVICALNVEPPQFDLIEVTQKRSGLKVTLKKWPKSDKKITAYGFPQVYRMYIANL